MAGRPGRHPGQSDRFRGGLSVMPQRGFTLVELLIAIAILALLSVAASTLLGSSLENQQQIEQRAERLRALGTALVIMRRDLEQMAPRIGRDLHGDSHESMLLSYRDSEVERLQFTRLGRRQLPGSFVGSSLERVRYTLSEEKLQRHSAPVADPVAQTPWRTQTLLEGVRELRLRYYDGREWFDQWPPLSRASADAPVATLPRALSVELELEGWESVSLQVLVGGGS